MLFQQIESFFETTSIHGVGFIVNKRLSLIARSFWAAFVLLSFTIAIKLINESIKGK